MLDALTCATSRSQLAVLIAAQRARTIETLALRQSPWARRSTMLDAVTRAISFVSLAVLMATQQARALETHALRHSPGGPRLDAEACAVATETSARATTQPVDRAWFGIDMRRGSDPTTLLWQRRG